MSQILLAWGGATLTNTEEIAIMASSTHSNIASLLAFKALFSWLGVGLGSAISGAIWMNTLPGKLEKHLPDNLKGNSTVIFGSLKKQLSYKWGSPERNAIIDAYSETQRIMTITATVIVTIATVFVLIWRDLKLKERNQTPGNVL